MKLNIIFKNNGFRFICFLTFMLAFSSNKNLKAETRLLYPQEKALKSVSNQLSKVIRTFKSFNNEHKNKTYALKPDPLNTLLSKVETIEKEFLEGKFPEDNKKVNNLKSWFPALKTNIPILLDVYPKGYLANQKELAKGNIENFPDYNADCDRLKKMYYAYKNPSSTFQNLKKALEVVPIFADEYAYFKNLPTKYALLIKAKKATKLETWIRTNKNYLDPFKKYMDEYSEKLPNEINSSIDSAASMAQKAKNDKKPMFFKGGVRQHLDAARNKLSILVAIKGEDDSEVLKATNYFNVKQKIIDDAEESLAAELLSNVETPKDIYNGSDKSKFLGMIKSEWKKNYPSDKILAVRFHNSNFERKTSWKWNNSGWYKVDTSFMSVIVVVKKNDLIAMLYPCFINKNHMKGDRITIGAQTKKSSFVIRKMLMKNLKL